MNYHQIYSRLVNRGKSRKLAEYTELHHIIPRCMGGSDDADNLVELTPEEHYIAHQLLVKMYPSNTSLVNAAIMMRPNRPSNKIYGWLKRRYSIIAHNRQTGPRNSRYGTKWIHCKSEQKNKAISKDDLIPDGWEIGRIIKWNKLIKKSNPEKIRRLEIQQQKLKLKRIRSKHYNIRRSEWYIKAKSFRLYEEFKRSNMSLRKFAKHKNMWAMTLSNWFKTYITEYSINVSARKSAIKQISSIINRG